MNDQTSSTPLTQGTSPAPAGTTQTTAPSAQTVQITQMGQMGQTAISAPRQSIFLAYGLFAAGMILPVFSLVGLILVHLQQDGLGRLPADGSDGELYSHARWLIRTFWFGLLGGLLGLMTIFTGIGFVVLLGAYVWAIYRLVKGFLALQQQQPVSLTSLI